MLDVEAGGEARGERREAGVSKGSGQWAVGSGGRGRFAASGESVRDCRYPHWGERGASSWL